MRRVIECDIDAVEIHTGDYAKNFLDEESIEQYLEGYQKAFNLLKKHSIGFHAGHGLTSESVMPLVKQGLFEEYNIGHAIICESIFEGLGQCVKKYKKCIEG